jgi:hypothetical protein
MTPKEIIIKIIKAYKREGYTIFRVTNLNNGIGILIYPSADKDPDALIYINESGCAYYINIDGKMHKYCFIPAKIENLRTFVSEVLQ